MDELQPWIINIDETKFRVFWQKIGENQEQVPSILLEEYPDEKMRKKDKEKKVRTLGRHTDDNTIYIFYKNFLNASYKNKDSFHKEIVDTLAHEVSHARLTQGNAGIRSLLHNSTQWILKNLIILDIAAFTLFFALTFLGFVSYLSLHYPVIFLISLCISFLAACIAVYVLTELSHRYREAVTDSYAADLMSIYKNDLMDMVHVVTLTDLFPKTAYGQFLLGYHSARIAAENLQQKSLN